MLDPEGRLARGLELFHAGRFYEAHEEWEAAWRLAPRSARFFLQGLVHCAAAHHHASRGNFRGAVLQAERAARKLAGYLPAFGGVDTRGLLADLRSWTGAWQRGLPVARATIGVRR